MKAFNGYEAKKPSGEREKLPAGTYVAKILNAEEVVYTWGSVLLISFDIAEGEKKGFFKQDYDSNTNEDKKWRGVYRLSIPKDDGSEKDGWTKNTFGNAMWAIEESNPGFRWSWDETALKGKLVGVGFRDKEWEMETSTGEVKTGWTTECSRLSSVEDVRSGKAQTPKAKPLPANKKAQPAFNELTDMSDTSDLPWGDSDAL